MTMDQIIARNPALAGQPGAARLAMLMLLSRGGSGQQQPDFTIEYQSVTNSWGTSVVAILVPNAAAIAAGVRFELVGEPAGLAVSNG